MQFLSTESQASLSALGDIVDRKMSKLRSNSEIETTRFRHAVYLTFIKRHHIKDPCGSKPGYQRVVACFMEQLMLDHNSRSATVRGYVEAINILFKLWNFKPTADFSDRTNMCTQIIIAREKEECIARQQNLITREIFSALFDLANNSPINSAEAVVADWFILIQITGLRCAEFAQKSQTSVEEHKYPLGKRVIKACISSDWKFYNERGRLASSTIEVPEKLKITFRIKKKQA